MDRHLKGQPGGASPPVRRHYAHSASGEQGDYGDAQKQTDRELLRENALVLSVRAGHPLHDAGGLLCAAGDHTDLGGETGHGDCPQHHP